MTGNSDSYIYKDLAQKKSKKVLSVFLNIDDLTLADTTKYTSNHTYATSETAVNLSLFRSNTPTKSYKKAKQNSK